MPAPDKAWHGRLADAGHRRVASLTHRIHTDRAGALLPDSERCHRPAIGQPVGQPAALVECEVNREVRLVRRQPVHADTGRAVLLVSGHDQHQVAARPKPLSSQGRERDRAGSHLVLHVQRAPAPQVPIVIEDRAEGWVRPVARVRRHDVAVADERQAGPPPVPGRRAIRFWRAGSGPASSTATPCAAKYAASTSATAVLLPFVESTRSRRRVRSMTSSAEVVSGRMASGVRSLRG